MELTICTSCSDNKTAIVCSKCSDATCKHCSYFVDEDSFDFVSLLPEEIRDKAFCPNCYHANVSDQLEEHQNLLKQAKEVDVYMIDQGKETRLIKRKEKPFKIENCEDREETLMRLAFLAAQNGFNTLVDVNLKSNKVSKGGAYKANIWTGTAIPVNHNKSN